jgi:hypothetical protein
MKLVMPMRVGEDAGSIAAQEEAVHSNISNLGRNASWRKILERFKTRANHFLENGLSLLTKPNSRAVRVLSTAQFHWG